MNVIVSLFFSNICKTKSTKRGRRSGKKYNRKDKRLEKLKDEVINKIDNAFQDFLIDEIDEVLENTKKN